MESNRRPNQVEQIRAYMRSKKDKSITAKEAMVELGIMRLASRINEMKKDGDIITKEMVYGTNYGGRPMHYAKYTLKEEEAEG